MLTLLNRISFVFTATLIIAITIIAPLTAIEYGADESVWASAASRTIYIDATNGSDANPGTAAAPLKSFHEVISHIYNTNSIGLSVEVIAKPGIYREKEVEILRPPGGISPSVFTILRAEDVNAGNVIIRGSLEATNLVDAGGGVYTQLWTNTWGYQDAPQSGMMSITLTNETNVLRREMVFVDGKMYRFHPRPHRALPRAIWHRRERERRTRLHMLRRRRPYHGAPRGNCREPRTERLLRPLAIRREHGR